MNSTALILGISGQDGAYLAEFLLGKGYEVHGTSRDVGQNSFGNLKALGILDKVQLHSAEPRDFRSLLQVVSDVAPVEIYNLAGQSSVGHSFFQPISAFESIAVATVQLLEVLRYLNSPARLYNASSGECFGAVPEGESCDELRPFSPSSPYAMAKAAAYWATANYRQAYGIYACSGILFNHESPLRPTRFVTRKIVSTAARIAAGESLRLELGNLDIWRDWGWAPEYVLAMWAMLQQDSPEDLVIATGESHSLKEFLAAVFAANDLEWEAHVDISPELLRPSDIAYNRGNPSLAKKRLNWTAETNFQNLVNKLVAAESVNITR